MTRFIFILRWNMFALVRIVGNSRVISFILWDRALSDTRLSTEHSVSTYAPYETMIPHFQAKVYTELT